MFNIKMSIYKDILKYLVLFIYFLLINAAQATNRHINCTVYPGSDTLKALNLVHIVAVGDKDSVHYLWSTYKIPSMIVARTTIEAQLVINMTTGALRFSEDPLAMTGLTISEVFEKSYSSDTAGIDQTSSVIALGIESFQWSNITEGTYSCSDSSASLQLTSYTKEGVEISENGVFKLKFSVSGSEEDASEFPHLVFTGNSTQLKVAFDDFHSVLNSTRTRYGLEMMLFNHKSENCSDVECKANVVDTITDEFSPGIFSDVNVVSPCSQKDNEKGSFLSWRPVAYISKEPTVANSSDAYMSGNCPQASKSTARSIAELFFDNQTDVSANMFNMTFGTVGGGFYAKTQYTEWSLMLGTGISVNSKLSIAAIVLLSIGVGGVGLSLLGGVIFFTVQLCRRRDDDLLLSESIVN